MVHGFKKNETKSLRELGYNGAVLTVTLGWERALRPGLISKLLDKREDADLDISCVAYDVNGEKIDCIWYGQLKSKDGAIRHSGDEVEGEDDRDDEAVTINFNQLSPQCDALYFVVSSFGGRGMACTRDMYWRLVDRQSRREIARYDIDPPPANGEANAKIVLRINRQVENGMAEWVATALDAPASGQNVQEVFSEIRALMRA